jgi:hypothetical protein
LKFLLILNSKQNPVWSTIGITMLWSTLQLLFYAVIKQNQQQYHNAQSSFQWFMYFLRMN